MQSIWLGVTEVSGKFQEPPTRGGSRPRVWPVPRIYWTLSWWN